MVNTLAVILVVAAGVAAQYLILSGILFGIAWAFDFDMTWKVTLGMWLIFLLISNLFKGNSNG